jgi:hypothetical protein
MRAHLDAGKILLLENFFRKCVGDSDTFSDPLGRLEERRSGH